MTLQLAKAAMQLAEEKKAAPVVPPVVSNLSVPPPNFTPFFPPPAVAPNFPLPPEIGPPGFPPAGPSWQAEPAPTWPHRTGGDPRGRPPGVSVIKPFFSVTADKAK